MGSHFLLQGISLTQELNPGLLHWQADSLPLSHLENPSYLVWYPDSSVGEESVCNAGDPALIPVSGRSAREGIVYPLQYSWASLVAQLVKNPPAMPETSV